MLRKFALVFGVLYIIAGIMGFVPALVQPPHDAPHLAVESGHGRLLGLFPINILHNAVHLLIGAWGILGSRSASAALIFARGLAIVYGLLAILGLIPATNTLFGLVPIHDHDVWLHAGSALIAAYFGFGPPAQAKSAAENS
jgi:hypothetical protein